VDRRPVSRHETTRSRLIREALEDYGAERRRLDRIRTVDGTRLTTLLGLLGPGVLEEVDRALPISLGTVSL